MEMSVSVKTSSKMSNLKHNNRDLNEEDKLQEAHMHIDYDKSDLNRYLIQEDLKEVYHKLFDKSLQEYNESQKRADRKISDFYKHVQKSETLDLQREFIFTLGSKNEWDNLSFEDKLEAADLLADYVNEFKERHSNLYVYNAVVHVDEKGAPHAHVNVVPIATGYKRGLKCKPSFSKALANEGYLSKGKHQLKEFKDVEAKELEKKLNSLGIERKLVGTRNIKDMHEYKELMSKINNEVLTEQEIAKTTLRELESKIESVKDNIEIYQEDFDNLYQQVQVERSIRDELKDEIENLKSETFDSYLEVEKSNQYKLELFGYKDIDEVLYDAKKLKSEVSFYQNVIEKVKDLASSIKFSNFKAVATEIFNVVSSKMQIKVSLSDFKAKMGKLSSEKKNAFYERVERAETQIRSKAYDNLEKSKDFRIKK